MKTTPTEALEVILCSPSLDQLIICLVRLTAYRLKCQGKWKDAELLPELSFQRSRIESLGTTDQNL